MQEIDKKILETIAQIIPTMTSAEKERLLYFAEGMACQAELQREGVDPIAPGDPIN